MGSRQCGQLIGGSGERKSYGIYETIFDFRGKALLEDQDSFLIFESFINDDDDDGGGTKR